MISSRKAGLIENKLVQIIILLVFVAVMIIAYIAFRDRILSDLKYALNFF